MAYIESTAITSPCRKYRYTLDRVWDSSKPKCGFIMLNPSTANAIKDDPTIRKCIGFARRFNFGGIHVRNLFTLVTPSPRELMRAENPVRPPDSEYFDFFVNRPDGCDDVANLRELGLLIAAWGRYGSFLHRGDRIKHNLLEWEDLEIKCFGYCKNGEPRHPLMLPYSTPLEKFV